KFTRVQARPQNIQINLSGQLGPQTEIQLCAVTKDHRRVFAENDRNSRIVVVSALNQPVWTGEITMLGAPADDVDHYLLLSRDRAAAVFDDFAMEPWSKPPASVSPEQVGAADAALARMQVAQAEQHATDVWKMRSAEMDRINALPRDPKTPEGA